MKNLAVNEDTKQCCFEFRLRNLGHKADFFEVEHTVAVEHYSEKNGDERKRTLLLKSSDNVCSDMAEYDRANDEHVTYLCANIASAVVDVTGISGSLKLASGNYTTTLHLNKETLMLIDLPQNTISRSRTVNKGLCKTESCEYCRPTCAALFHDSAQVLCDSRITNVLAAGVPLKFQDGGVYYANSRTVCINAHGPPDREYSVFAGVNRRALLRTICRSVTNRAGDTFVCFATDLQSLRDFDLNIYRVRVAGHGKTLEYDVKTTLRMKHMEFELSERTLPRNSQRSSCSKLVEQDWYVPLQKKKTRLH